MVNLGVLYLSGRLPGREQSEALGCFKMAADQGDLSGLWNLALCYERGVGVARDPIAAQALQQQCRDREAGGRRPSVTGDQAGPLAPHLRRSSDPSASAIPPPTADNGNDNKANGSESEVNARRRSSGRRSSSVPLVTPPPPEGAPPPTATRGNPLANYQNISPESEATAASRRSSSSSKQPYKYVPKRDGPLPTDTTDRPSTSSNSQAAEVPAAGGKIGRNSQDMPQPGAADDAASPTGARTGGPASAPWIPPPPRDRKNSLLLKPTPQAIARVKAAVERRKKLQAPAASAAPATDTRNPDGLPTAAER
ncbi:unnamed protein product [Ectocarpus sp. 8 AP-2014]